VDGIEEENTMRYTMRIFGLAALGSAGLLLTAGCVRQPGATQQPPAKKSHVHDHPDEGPHGGALAEWGNEKYHAEFTVDHAKKQATVYLLDGSAKKAAPIAADTIALTLTNVKPPVRMALKAEPQEGDPKGQASRFTGTQEELGQKMEFKGEISGTVAGTPYAGTFEEKDHDHEKK
jgi:hypothetical protein